MTDTIDTSPEATPQWVSGFDKGTKDESCIVIGQKMPDGSLTVLAEFRGVPANAIANVISERDALSADPEAIAAIVAKVTGEKT